jgi:hypothetical protein
VVFEKYSSKIPYINFANGDITFFLFRLHIGARIGIPRQNRLKIGARREGTVSDDILETQRLPRTDG